MLKINLIPENTDNTMTMELALAVKFTGFTMTAEMLTDSIAKMEKRLNADGIDDAKRESIKADIADAKKALATAVSNADKARGYYDKVVSAMVAVGNDARNIDRIFRLIASADNSALIPYVMRSMEWDAETIYNAMACAHNIADYDDLGRAVHYPTARTAYQTAYDTISHDIKTAFSVPFASAYTNAFRMRMNKTQFAKLHENWVSGVRNNFKGDDKERVFKNSTLTTAITKKKNRKTGMTTYDCTRFNRVVATLMVESISA